MTPGVSVGRGEDPNPVMPVLLLRPNFSAENLDTSTERLTTEVCRCGNCKTVTDVRTLIDPAGFFVCKLKKLSNKKEGRGDEDGEGQDVEQAEEEFELLPETKEYLPTTNGKEKKGMAFKKAKREEGDTSDDNDEPVVAQQPEVKKKKEPGIVKKARAELLAELQAKKEAVKVPQKVARGAAKKKTKQEEKAPVKSRKKTR